jgi:hypothetical protein
MRGNGDVEFEDRVGNHRTTCKSISDHNSHLRLQSIVGTQRRLGTMADYPIRPQTPQAMLHRLPDKPDPSSAPDDARIASKYIILITASNEVAGKVQISKSVATALSCPLFEGDSLHKTAAKAAGLGASRNTTGAGGDEQATSSGQNEARYQRMWLSKMTRTGYLFPEESRPAMSSEGFAGFGGSSNSASTSRRGSASSVASSASDAAVSTSSVASSLIFSGPPTAKFVNKPPVSIFTLSDKEKTRKENKALIVVTHPDLEAWHKESIRKAVGEYGIAVIFVPLGERQEEEALPVLKSLDPRTMTGFGSFAGMGKRTMTLDEETVVRLDGNRNVEDTIEDIVIEVKEILDE